MNESRVLALPTCSGCTSGVVLDVFVRTARLTAVLLVLVSVWKAAARVLSRAEMSASNLLAATCCCDGKG